MIITADAIKKTDVILIDTSSLMNNTNMERALLGLRPLLLENNKQIIITAPVSLELLRHRTSKKQSKQYLAEQAEEIIRRNDDLFIIEDYNDTKKERYHAFADSTLLSRIILNKTSFSQLLITNDKRLGEDALNTNHTKSCHGKQVSVYSVTEDGTFEEVLLPITEPETTMIKEPAPQKGTSSFKEALYSICLVSIGLLLGAGGKHAYKYIKNIDWRVFV